MRYVLLSSLLFSFVACSSKSITLNPEASQVKVLKEDPPPSAVDMGPISGLSGSGCGYIGTEGTYEKTIIDIKNKAYQRGADYVQIMTIDVPHLHGSCFNNEYRINGNSYKVKTKAPASVK